MSAISIKSDLKNINEELVNVQLAYKMFSTYSNGSVKEMRYLRNDYFSAINELHTKLFYDADCFMHRDVYLNEAESVLGANGFFKEALHESAKQYVESFGELNKLISTSTATISEVKTKISELANAHFIFAEKFALAKRTMDRSKIN